jgi:hypothetical protein
MNMNTQIKHLQGGINYHERQAAEAQRILQATKDELLAGGFITGIGSSQARLIGQRWKYHTEKAEELRKQLRALTQLP